MFWGRGRCGDCIGSVGGVFEEEEGAGGVVGVEVARAGWRWGWHFESTGLRRSWRESLVFSATTTTQMHVPDCALS